MSFTDDEDDSFWDASSRAEHVEDLEMDGSDALTPPDWLRDTMHLAKLEPPSTTPTPLNASTLTTAPQQQATNAPSSATTSRNHSPAAIPVPAVPAIPEHHLATGKRATLFERRKGESARKEASRHLRDISAPAVRRSAKSTGEEAVAAFSSAERTSSRSRHGISDTSSSWLPDNARRKSLPALPTRAYNATLEKLESRSRQRRSADMSRLAKARNEDLFLELANDQSGAENAARPQSRGGRASSRMSFSGKRRSMPAESALPSPAERRPKTSSGQVLGNRPPSRLESLQSDLQRHVERYRGNPSRAAFQADDAVSMSSRSRAGLPHRYSAVPDRSAMSPSRNVELPHYGRRRPSFGNTPPEPQAARPSQLSKEHQDLYSESLVNSSEPKQSLQDSTSAESEAADTVWDELDDLKSRIKKLELTGKLPPTSGGAVSAEANERPRTATTAPTTITSSPKVEKSEKKPEVEPSPADAATDKAVGTNVLANIHPNLHSALAKAKLLLNAGLYRTLEATATDALQLAAMTGSAGPQGTAFSAAAIINGVTTSDRHVRRKADTMCRNLTDLCLALCEGKHEAPSIISSPVSLDTPAKSSPIARYARSSLGQDDGLSRSGGSRPMSRLEARRTSILGSQGGSSLARSLSTDGEDLSASERETTPSHLKVPETRRFSRAGSRLQSLQKQRDEDVSGDEDPTIRPASRAMTDIGRAKSSITREYGTPQQQRSPSLRDALIGRRTNATPQDSNREVSRISSLQSDSGSRRRLLEHPTSPVLEEERDDDQQPITQSKRRITSFGQHASRRATADLPNRATSLNQRRHIVVE